MVLIDEVLETCLYVNDIDVAEEFYSRLLNAAAYSRQGERHVFFRVGKTMLLLFNPDETGKPGSVPAHGAMGPGHVAFTVSHARIDFWHARLRELDIEIEQEYDWPSGGKSIYFRDPFNNSLELATKDTWP